MLASVVQEGADRVMAIIIVPPVMIVNAAMKLDALFSYVRCVYNP